MTIGELPAIKLSEMRGSITMRNHRRDGGFSLIETMAVTIITVIVASLAVTAVSTSMSNIRGRGSTRSIGSAIALAKLRAAASFTNARVYADLSSQTFSVQVWNKTSNAWVVDGGIQNLEEGVTFGYGGLTVAPPNTQSSIDQAAACRDNAAAVIANTACVIFNSRGIPVDSTGSPYGNGGRLREEWRIQTFCHGRFGVDGIPRRQPPVY